ncbi:hypothetical protein L6R50_15360 [Myxococcota bacterium]|nr:hypothetical protein [Myxococcota bacterium]
MCRRPPVPSGLLVAGLIAGCASFDPAEPRCPTEADVAAAESARADGPETGAQPLFDLVFKVHIEPTSVDGEPAFDVREAVYRQRLDGVDHVAVLAEAHGAKLSIHANGEFWEYVSDLGDADRVQAWIDAGHHVGLHTHPLEWVGPHQWNEIDGTTVDAEQGAALWEAPEAYARAALPGLDLTGATPWDAENAYAADLLARWGHTLLGGGPNNIADELLGHEVWNPWRYAPGTVLGEDPDAPAVLIPHRGQVGEALPHGPHHVFRDNTVPHIKVLALQAALEREAAERHGDPPRPWVFGFLQHDNRGGDDGTLHDADIEEVLSFLDATFVDAGRSVGRIGRYASYDEVGERFARWEEANPGASAFHYEEGGPYPYHLAALASALKTDPHAQVDHEAVERPPGGVDGVRAHRLRISRRGEETGAPVWLAWREPGGAAEWDLRDALATQGLSLDRPVRIYDGETCAASEADPAHVPVGRVPALIYPARSTP